MCANVINSRNTFKKHNNNASIILNWILEDFIIYKMSLVSTKYKRHMNCKVAKNLKYIKKVN